MIGERFGPTWHGQKGALTHVGDKAQCHICGKAFHHLGAHVVGSHRISVVDYKDEFGLNRTTPLISMKLARKRRASAPAMPKDLWRKRKAVHRRTTGASLQERLNPDYKSRRLKALEAARVVVMDHVKAGTWRPGPKSPEAMTAMQRLGVARLAQLRLDPEWCAAVKSAQSIAALKRWQAR